MNQFTAGQKERMQGLWEKYRANYKGPYKNGLEEVKDPPPRGEDSH